MFATDIIVEILADFALFVAPSVAEEELLYVYLDDAKQRRRLIDSTFFAEHGLTPRTAILSQAEQERFITYAGSVDDGEAQSLAIAKERGLPILTDDVAGMKLAIREGIELRTTIGLIRMWSASKSRADVRAVLRRIEQRGRYRPHANHPDYAWYIEMLAE